MTTATVTAPTATITRDRFGRPLVIPPDGGKPVAYTRATTLASAVEDTFNLARWQQRMVAVGLADRPDLQLAVTAHRNDKGRLNDICEQAIEAAKGTAAATTGTALHTLTELVDLGQDLPIVPPDAEADLAAYRETTACLQVEAIEQFVVIDDLKVGGTPDRIVRWNGERLIADIKTGSIEWGIQKIAMQLALYAHGKAYDPATGQRSPLNVNQTSGLIIHLPAGSGQCELVWVDLKRGWEAVELAVKVREWRKAKGLTAPFQAAG